MQKSLLQKNLFLYDVDNTQEIFSKMTLQKASLSNQDVSGKRVLMRYL